MSRIEDTTGQNFLGNTVKYTCKEALKGAYSLLWRTHTPLDFLSTRDLETIHRYRLVYLPAMLVVDGAVASILEDYVRQGGFLIAEEGLGLRDTRYWMATTAPGAGLDRLFGANQGKTIQSAVPGTLQLAGAELPVVGRRALLHPRGGRVVAEWPEGGAAAVAHVHGGGRTLLYGFHLGQCSAETRGAAYLWLARSWLAEAGVAPGIRFPDGGEPMVQWRSGTSLGKRMVYLLNYEPHPVRVTLGCGRRARGCAFQHRSPVSPARPSFPPVTSASWPAVDTQPADQVECGGLKRLSNGRAAGPAVRNSARRRRAACP